MPNKTINEIIRTRVHSAGNDLLALAELRANSCQLGLSDHRLDVMFEALADHVARLEGLAGQLKALPDPRGDEAWRKSAEGKALERVREERILKAKAREK